MKPQKEFVFRKHMRVGAPDAESDHEFIRDCFVDTGDLDVLLDTSRHECIVLGRTGTGKSALLESVTFDSTHNVIKIDPENLALSYVSNSNVIRFFEALGVHLDVFYKLLWSHTLVVELIKNRYNIHDENSKRGFLARWMDYLGGDPAEARAWSYFEQWGSDFWLETETRVKELTDKLETELSAAAKLSGLPAEFAVKGAETLSSEVKSQVAYNGQAVVNKVQIRELNRLIELLSDYAFSDPQQKYYLLIDRLDVNWVDDRVRYKLIRALIETIRNLKKFTTVKIIIALRNDLLWRVFDKTKDAGFQREKYENYFLRVKWTDTQLRELINRRVNHVLKYKYTNSELSADDILPRQITDTPSIEYILRRTLLRPRDVIAFFNECFEAAAGKAELAVDTIRAAEKRYSTGRLASLSDEWHSDYPRLEFYTSILRNRKSSIQLRDLDDEKTDAFMCLLYEEEDDKDPLFYVAQSWLNGKAKRFDFIVELVDALYKTGCVGVKYDGQSNVMYCQHDAEFINRNRLSSASHIYVQRMLWSELKIDDSRAVH